MKHRSDFQMLFYEKIKKSFRYKHNNYKIIRLSCIIYLISSFQLMISEDYSIQIKFKFVKKKKINKNNCSEKIFIFYIFEKKR